MDNQNESYLRRENKKNGGRFSGKRGFIMKRNIYLLMVLIGTIVPCATALTITDVQISPAQPAIHDIITIETAGGIPGGGIYFDNSNFIVDGLSLQLDMYFTETIGTQIPKPWFHDEVIGTLPQGDYDLLVQAYWRPSVGVDYILHDDYSTNFEVVPEPITLAFLALGAAFIRRK